MKHQKSLLRNELRQRRRALSCRHQRLAAQRVARALKALPEYQNSQHIALYLHSDGELACDAIVTLLGHQQRHCYLPVVSGRRGHMHFYPYRANQLLLANRYQLQEPAQQRRVAKNPRALDIVLLPLVGFDRQGHRLGMGGGYYDRAFAFKHSAPRHTRPLMIGIAHSIQEVAKLPAEPWDVPLDIILTERETLRLRRRR
jgi:5-formyltetrahydrofolate cyclo-ligase